MDNKHIHVPYIPHILHVPHILHILHVNKNMGKRKREALEKEIEDMERLYDNCEEQMESLRKLIDKVQNAWNSVYVQLDVLYKRRKTKRVRPSIKGVMKKRQVSFPEPSKSM